jgi:hypothetical protein
MKSPTTMQSRPSAPTTTTTLGKRAAKWAAVATTLVALGTTSFSASAGHVAPLLECSSGPSGQRFDVGVSLPAYAEVGSTYSVRIDGVSSGKISHFGLNYLHDMTVDYVLPADASYVEGSAELVPGTGTANVLASARLTHRAGVVTLALPARVAEGTSYTPPSIRFQLRATGAPGTAAAVSFRQFRLTANAIVVGEVAVSCNPTVNPSPLGATLITAPAHAANP